MKRKLVFVAFVLLLVCAYWLWTRQTQASRIRTIHDKGGSIYAIRPLPNYTWIVRILGKNVRDRVMGSYGGLCIGISWRTAQATDHAILDSLRVGHVIELDLSHSSVTDAGLVELGKSRSLEEISLFDTQITNQGLLPLCEAPSLRKIDVRGTSVSADAVQQCLQMNPRLMIQSNHQ